MQTIYLIDDDPAVRDSLSVLLEQHDYAVRTFSAADEFLAAARPDWQGCAVVDLRMPAKDGLALQEEMVSRGLLIPVVFLTGHGDIPATVRAMKSGAVDFLTKPVRGETLLSSLRSAFEVAFQLDDKQQKNREAQAAVDGLTEREREVMKLVAKGMSNKEVARELGISHRTVEIHRARVMRKTGAASEMDLFQILQVASDMPRIA